MNPRQVCGPLWNDSANVLACLRRYVVAEGHASLLGKTVEQAAQAFMDDPYAADGQELSAVHRLLALGCADATL